MTWHLLVCFLCVVVVAVSEIEHHCKKHSLILALHRINIIKSCFEYVPVLFSVYVCRILCWKKKLFIFRGRIKCCFTKWWNWTTRVRAPFFEMKKISNIFFGVFERVCVCFQQLTKKMFSLFVFSFVCSILRKYSGWKTNIKEAAFVQSSLFWQTIYILCMNQGAKLGTADNKIPVVRTLCANDHLASTGKA